MALQTCPDCQHEVSESALTCPQCGRALVLGPEFCPYCQQPTAKKVQGVFGAESLITILLLCLGIVPGAIYYFDVTRYPYCTACDRRIRKRVDTRAVETPYSSRCEKCMKTMPHKTAASGAPCGHCKHVQSWATVVKQDVVQGRDPVSDAHGVAQVLPPDVLAETRVPAGTAVPLMGIADELAKLAALRDSGVLSADEFESQKAKLLGM